MELLRCVECPSSSKKMWRVLCDHLQLVIFVAVSDQPPELRVLFGVVSHVFRRKRVGERERNGRPSLASSAYSTPGYQDIWC